MSEQSDRAGAALSSGAPVGIPLAQPWGMRNVRGGAVLSKKWLWRSVLAGLTVGASLASASAAWACSIAPWYAISPGHDAVDVPRNVRVSFLEGAGTQEPYGLERERADGTFEAVDVTVTAGPGSGTHGFLELRPTALLEPSTQYRITGPWGEVSRFTTGTHEDTTPPGKPSLSELDITPYLPRSSPQAGAACWVERGFTTFTLKSDGAAHFRLERAGEVIAQGLPENGSFSYECPASTKKYDARLVAVDAAGNESEAVEVRIEERCERDLTPGQGCTAAGGGAGLLGLFAVAATLRRQRSKLSEFQSRRP